MVERVRRKDVPGKPGGKRTKTAKVDRRHNNRGYPDYYPTDEHRMMVKMLVATGCPQEKIRLLILNPRTQEPISIETLQKNFKHEIDTAKEEVNLSVAQKGLELALGRRPIYVKEVDKKGNERYVELDKGARPDAGMIQFWLKARAGWKETVVKENVGKDGEPLEGSKVFIMLPDNGRDPELARKMVNQQGPILIGSGRGE